VGCNGQPELEEEWLVVRELPLLEFKGVDRGLREHGGQGSLGVGKVECGGVMVLDEGEVGGIWGALRSLFGGR